MSADARVPVEECSDSRLNDFQNTSEDLGNIFDLMRSIPSRLKLPDDGDDDVIFDVLGIDSLAYLYTSRRWWRGEIG